MANPNNPDITFVDTEFGLNSPVEIETARIGKRTFAYVTSELADAVTIFEVNGDGTLDTVGSVGDTTAVSLDGPAGLTSTEIKGTPFLFVGGGSDDGVTAYRIRANGTLDFKDAVFDDDDFTSLTRLDGVSEGLEAFQIGRSTYLAVTARLDAGIQIVKVRDKGKLDLADSASTRDNAPDAFDYKLGGARDMAHLTVGKRDFVFVVTDQSVLSVFEVEKDGDLRFVAAESDNSTLALFSAEGVAAATVAGRPYVFAAGGDPAISTFQVGRDGTLSSVATFTDEDRSVLDDVADLDAFEIDGTWYLAASDDFTDTIGVYRIAKNGALTEIAALVDTAEAALNGVQTAAVATLANGTTVLLGAGEFTSGGLSSFLFDVGQAPAGPKEIEGGKGKDKLTGTNKADSLAGLAGKDVLKAKGGDDILDGGKGNDRLIGNGGDDTFRFAGKFGKDTIADFDGAGDDVVEIAARRGEAKSAGAFLDALSQKGSDVVYDFGDDGRNTITFLDTDLSDFSRADVTFA